jgi:DnaJ-domain-containing protein 1
MHLPSEQYAEVLNKSKHESSSAQWPPLTLKVLVQHDNDEGTAIAEEGLRVFELLVAEVAGSFEHSRKCGSTVTQYHTLLQRIVHNKQVVGGSKHPDFEALLKEAWGCSCKKCNDAYKTLEVENSADADAIKTAYHDLAMV